MPDDTTPQAPAALPWYRSAVLQGILTVIVTQLIGRVQAKYHVDLSVFGLNVNDIVSWAMDALSAAALAYAAHARVAKPLPAITGTQASADKANAAPPSA